MEGDGTSALKALNDVKRGMGDVKNVMAQEITQKIKQAFSVAAIEEMTRRTAEWANQLTNTARKLQVTTDELQGFQVQARKLGMDESKVEGWFNTLEDSAYNALQGNNALILSFQKLGIGMDKLRDKKFTPAKLFEAVMGGMKTAGGVQGAQEIFGRSEAVDVANFAKGMGGKTGAQMAAENSDQVVDKKALDEIKASWAALMQSLVKVRTLFSTFVSFLLDLVTGLVEMVRGTLAMVARGWKLISFGLGSLLGSDASKAKFNALGEESKGAGGAILAGIRNSLRGMVNFGARLVGADTGAVAKGIGRMEGKPKGMSDKLWAESQATGAAITTLGLGGTRGITGKGPAGLSGVAAGYVKTSTNLAGPMVGALMRGTMRIGSMEQVAALWEAVGLGPFKAPASLLEAEAMLAKIETAITTAKGMGPAMASRIADIMASTGAVLGATGIAGGLGTKQKSAATGEVPFGGRNPMMNIGGFGASGGGSSNLRIGGVFGTDVSFKILQINADMLTTMQSMLKIMEEGRNPMTYVTTVGLH
jgi:hypothetical protein